MMDRRIFVGSVAATALGFTGVTRAQKTDLTVIGFLNLAAAADWAPHVVDFQHGLAVCSRPVILFG
jgi:uncharacterized membrane protein YtjA (UPF0391 family)